ncbi:uncharacterized protein STAUR_4109 [Stigmatella aurantiaca DW4/3-1]|uniref:Uncharacterized protein n=1 Tax=Stigmatella aurantiaca (strain DW4/3-1) TaxID=378806 RepID=E3FP83_STIAD|nr:uncharacterized protein STAUR_4109 [Stigmatella aurantiaca DW4/3-1]
MLAHERALRSSFLLPGSYHLGCYFRRPPRLSGRCQPPWLFCLCRLCAGRHRPLTLATLSLLRDMGGSGGLRCLVRRTGRLRDRAPASSRHLRGTGAQAPAVETGRGCVDDAWGGLMTPAFCRLCGKPLETMEARHRGVHFECPDDEAAPEKPGEARLLNAPATWVCLPLFRAVAQARLAASHLAQTVTHLERARAFLAQVQGEHVPDVSSARLAFSAHALDAAVLRVSLEEMAQGLETEAETTAGKAGRP